MCTEKTHNGEIYNGQEISMTNLADAESLGLRQVGEDERFLQLFTIERQDECGKVDRRGCGWLKRTREGGGCRACPVRVCVPPDDEADDKGTQAVGEHV